MEVKLDEKRVEEVLENIQNIFNQLEINLLNLNFLNNTVKVVETLPQQIDTLTTSFQELRDIGKLVVSDLTTTKDVIVTMGKEVAKAIESATLNELKE